jgi:hypothetical protein
MHRAALLPLAALVQLAPGAGVARAQEEAPLGTVELGPISEDAGGPSGLDVPDAADAARIALGFHLGFGGKFEVGNLEGDADPTVGAHLRLEIPVHDFFAIGPLFLFGAARPDGSEDDRDFYLDFDLLLRGRVPIGFGGGHADLGIGLPVGFTLALDGNGDADPAFGWNIGVLIGAQIFFGGSFGLLAEIGFLHHWARLDDAFLGEVGVVLNQGVLNLGLVFLLR